VAIAPSDPDGVVSADTLGAFCRDNQVAIAGAAEGPLARLSFAVKDIFDIKGTRTGFGHPLWLASHAPADATAAAVQRLLDAGATMVGKTHTDELAYSLTGENVHYGTPVNPWDRDRVAGGSSSGSVAAVAGGLVDFAIGTDCGGSVRLPASYCGVIGMRPTHGRVPLDGAIPFAPSFDCPGWFARTSEVCEAVGRVLLADQTEPRKPRRLLRARDAFDLVDREVVQALEPAVAALVSHIGTPEDVVVSPQALRDWFQVFRTLQAAEIWANHGAWIRANRPEFGPGVRERLEWAAAVGEADVGAAKEARQAVVARLEALLEPGDVMCLPTSPRVAPLKNTATDTLEIEYRHQAMCLLCIAGLGGLPQINLPLALLDGLPVGLSIIGPRGSDLDLLQVATSLGVRAPTPSRQ